MLHQRDEIIVGCFLEWQGRSSRPRHNAHGRIALLVAPLYHPGVATNPFWEERAAHQLCKEAVSYG